MQLAEADLAAQARNTASSAAKGLQSGTKMAAERFNNFVEDSGGSTGARSKAQPEKKEFWDSFGEPEQKAGSSIGTAAMRKGGGGGGGVGNGGTGKEDGWDNW